MKKIVEDSKEDIRIKPLTFVLVVIVIIIVVIGGFAVYYDFLECINRQVTFVLDQMSPLLT